MIKGRIDAIDDSTEVIETVERVTKCSIGNTSEQASAAEEIDRVWCASQATKMTQLADPIAHTLMSPVLQFIAPSPMPAAIIWNTEIIRSKT